MGKVINKQEVRVYVKMHDGTRLLGSFYLTEEERLQDIMNDARAFLPLHTNTKAQKPQITMISKRYIEQVEEVSNMPTSNTPLSQQPDDRRDGLDRRSGEDRRQIASALQLEVEDSSPAPGHGRRSTDR